MPALLTKESLKIFRILFINATADPSLRWIEMEALSRLATTTKSEVLNWVKVCFIELV